MFFIPKKPRRRWGQNDPSPLPLMPSRVNSWSMIHFPDCDVAVDRLCFIPNEFIKYKKITS